ELLDDFDVNVRFEQRQADLAHGLADIFFRQRSLAAQVLKGALEFVRKIFKHREEDVTRCLGPRGRPVFIVPTDFTQPIQALILESRERIMSDLRHTAVSDSPDCWPALPLASWKDTYDTLHMWTQIVGKIRLALTPQVNHWWGTALYVSARGLTTSVIPHGKRVFEMEFDLLEHQLRIQTCDPTTRLIPLAPRSVADFYRECMSVLQSLGLEIE